MKEIKFDVYAINWNEERLLPYFFKHYSQANKIYIMDNNSTDNSKFIIENYGGIIIPFDTSNTLDDTTNIKLKNEIWKRSRTNFNYSNNSNEFNNYELCDFVIVQDLDEFLFFPEFPNDLLSGLSKMKSLGITIIKSIGYNMFCSDEQFEKVKNRKLSATITYGNTRPIKEKYNKMLCFNPNEINEINYLPGAHLCNPIGNINIDSTSTLLLHYKYIGKNYLTSRYIEYSKRLSQTNIDNTYGFEYLLDAKTTIDDYYSKYSHWNIFRIMWKNLNIGQINFNSSSCLIDTFGSTDIISRVVLDNNIWEPKVANYIRNNISHDTTLIDIGCNIGYTSCIAILSGVNKIYAFECNKRTYDKFANTIKINGFENIELFNIGISDQKGTLEFNEVEDNIGASHIISTHIGWNGKIKKSENVQVDLLDNIVKSINILSNNIIVKIDVEGHELQVLKGSLIILKDPRTSQIIIELNPQTSSYNTLNQIIDYVVDIGFNIPKILFDISIDKWYGKWDEKINPFHIPQIISIENLKQKLQMGVIIECVFNKQK